MESTLTKQTNAPGLTKSIPAKKTPPTSTKLSTEDLMNRAKAPFKFKPLGPSRQFGINE